MIYDKETKIILSLSKKPGNFGTKFHNFLYRELELNFFYKASTCQNLELAISAIKNLNFRGMSISMPYKQKVLSFVDRVEETATLAGGANTLVNDHNTIMAYNTDWYALNHLMQNKKNNLQNILIYGTGAVAQMCMNYFNGKNIYLAGRSSEKVNLSTQKYPNINVYQEEQDIDLLINATPLHLEEVHIKNLSKFPVILDYPIFNLKNCYKPKDSGQEYFSGLDITLLQARKQFELYTKQKLDESIARKGFDYAS